MELTQVGNLTDHLCGVTTGKLGQDQVLEGNGSNMCKTTGAGCCHVAEGCSIGNGVQ